MLGYIPSACAFACSGKLAELILHISCRWKLYSLQNIYVYIIKKIACCIQSVCPIFCCCLYGTKYDHCYLTDRTNIISQPYCFTMVCYAPPQPPCRGHYSDEIHNKVTLSWCMWKSISCGHSDTGKMKFLSFLHSDEKWNWQPHFLDEVIANEVQILYDCYVYWHDREHSVLSNYSVCIT